VNWKAFPGFYSSLSAIPNSSAQVFVVDNIPRTRLQVSVIIEMASQGKASKKFLQKTNESDESYAERLVSESDSSPVFIDALKAFIKKQQQGMH
jgi:adenylate kinase family enzyme